MNAICPGCGWRGPVKPKLACPDCGWENNVYPWRLLTLKELMADKGGVYGNICMGDFLSSVLADYNAEAGRTEVRGSAKSLVAQTGGES